MAYKVFYTDVPLPQGISEPNFELLIALEFHSEQKALEDAFAKLGRNCIVWKIEGLDGVLYERQEINRRFFERTGRWPSQ